MNSYNLKQIENTLNKVHPMNIINKVNCNMSLFKVKIEYITSRKNKRQRELYFNIDTYNPQYDLTKDIKDWEKDYNKNKEKQRQISNATILESQCLGYLRI